MTMRAENLELPVRGIVVPLVTPLVDRDGLDVAGLERLIAHVIAGGVHGVFLIGTTGEGPSLSYRLRREVIDRAVRQVGGRVPVFVGITDTAFVESVELARHAARAGANAVVAAPPYYLPEGPPELQEYLDHILPELPLPLVLYNLPPLTKVPFDLATLERAMDRPEIVGLKDSSGDMNYFHRVCRRLSRRPDWSLLIGPEELLAEAVLLGGHGGVCGGANLFPRLYVDLYEAACRKDTTRLRELHRQVGEVSEGLYHVGHHSSAVIKGLKCALSCAGICSDFMAEPFHRFREPERGQIERALETLETLGIRPR